MSLELPEPRPVLWPLRPVDSATVHAAPVDDRLVVTIDHAPLHGVTPEMLAWWYAHVAGSMEYAGRMYLVWHPLDHISYEIVGDGVVGPGTNLHIVEALGRDPEKVLDLHVTVEDGHHVEEIGNLENFLPALFAQAVR